jgi:hypothetical protein
MKAQPPQKYIFVMVEGLFQVRNQGRFEANPYLYFQGLLPLQYRQQGRLPIHQLIRF